MNPVIVVKRGSRSCLSADEFLAELDKGSTLLFIKENRPPVTISRAVSAPQFIEPSVPVLQEEALGEPSSPHQDAEASVRSGVITPPPPESTAEEACPEEKAVVEDEDFEEGGSESSSHHELSTVSGTGYDTSSLAKGSSSDVDIYREVEALSIQPAPLSLPWVGQVPRAGMKLPAPVEEGSPQLSDLSYTVDHNASYEVSTPPSAEAAGTHQEDAHDSVTSEVSSSDGAAAPQTPAVPAVPEEAFNV
ncbi:uncharacterized protein [Misgurnus anguillicaudatus]|uniref:uncharacterized protein n=1 Tax=Misgurnus anguillicaudatus TaxID=75329 RepID=UPI003CCF582D